MAELVGIAPASVPASLQRAREARKIISVTKGGWVPVPPEYRKAGAPPPLHYVDPLMRHLGHPYYVGFLSASRLHGASHQVPMVLQVVTSAALRDRRIGSSQLQFIRRSATVDRTTQQIGTDTGRVTVSTPATTVLDIVETPTLAGGLGNVATVIGDLLDAEKLSDETLVAASDTYAMAVVQRAGFLIDHISSELGSAIELDRFAGLVGGADYVVLDPRRPPSRSRDARWKVDVNAEIEHDL